MGKNKVTSAETSTPKTPRVYTKSPRWTVETATAAINDCIAQSESRAAIAAKYGKSAQSLASLVKKAKAQGIDVPRGIAGGGAAALDWSGIKAGIGQ